MSFFSSSPETSLAGMGMLVGLLLIILGAVLPMSSELSEKLILTGIAMVSGSGGVGLMFSRSQAQHERDRPGVVQQVAETVKPVVVREVIPEVKDVAADVAKSTVVQELRR
jgi:hypothetical protein